MYKNSKDLQLLVYGRLISQHLTLQVPVMWHGNNASIRIDKKTQRNNSEHPFGKKSVSSQEGGYDEQQQQGCQHNQADYYKHLFLWTK